MKRIMLAMVIVLFAVSLTYAANYETITVQQGENLQTIATNHLKDVSMWQELLEFNGLTSPTQVRSGMQLKIPYSISINRVAKINFKNGTVQVQDGSRWTEGYVNQYLVQNDIIRTGNSSACNIELDDGTVIRVGANTQVELQGYNYQNGERNTNLDLDSGNLRLRVTRLTADADFSVSTVTAVAGVRGTEFYVEVDEDAADVDLAVYSGAVAVNSTRDMETGETVDDGVRLESGYGTTISSAGDIADPYPIPGQIQWAD